MKTKCFVFLACALELGCTHFSDSDAVATSPRALNSTPQEFNDEQVVVDGWLQFESEAYRLWESQSSLMTGKPDTNCVSVAVSRSVNPRALNDRHVRVQGKFVADASSEYILVGGCINSTLILVEKIEERRRAQ